MKKLAIILVSAVTAFSGVVPAQAFPMVNAPQVQTAQQVEKVQYHRHHEWRGGGHRYHRYHGGRHYRYDDRRWRYHRHHHGSNAGAIIGGLAAGAIIGGALAQPRYAPPRRYVGGNSHVNWCYSRYRSYRAYDNTFQPYNGPRQQCYSPYR
ncbi:BA14K family protein [Neorhizobium sp. NCHU2750]|uniref:BA14K family protein n=1 Tax=Neorhizobium sp. NCHU2750 TaxID=1825976 RepID=UPI000E735C4E|nr:hypothetical protein NCHU2750_11130 [Neorhizobium sp. NCHU2750]